MTHTVRSKWRFISDRSSLRGLTLVAMVGTFILGPSGLPVSGQGHSKPVIQLVAPEAPLPILAAVGFRFSRRLLIFEKTFPKQSGSWTAWSSK